MKSRRLPIVKAWLERDYEGIRRIAEAIPVDDPLHLHYRAMWDRTRGTLGQVSPDEIRMSLRRSLDSPPEDVELHLALLICAATVAPWTNRPGESERILRFIHEMKGKPGSLDWSLTLLLSEAAHFFFLGQGSKSLEILNQAEALGLRSGSIFWYLWKAQRVLTATCVGEIALAEQDLLEIEPYTQWEERWIYPIRFLRAFVCWRLGRIDEGLAVLGPVSRDEEAPNPRVMTGVRIDLLLEAGRLEEVAKLRVLLQSKGHPEYLVENLRAREALAAGDLPTARRHAQETIVLARSAPLFHLDDLFTTSAEVELASRHPKAARLILKMLDPEEDRLILRTFWGRLCLLERDEGRAAFHIRKVLEKAPPEYVQAGFRFAYEVAVPQLSGLLTRAAALPAEPALPPAKRVEARISLIGESAPLRKVRASIRKLAPLGQTVLLTGETGTGKEVVARLLHEQGAHPREPFIPVNCASISDTLIEAELFGYVKGAFTGAGVDHDGLLVAAGKGTLFLDEVNLMTLRLQAALLRALEIREVRPIGSTKVQAFEARILAATNVPLEQAIAKGEFRSDLYYRLATFQIELPPLRERTGDIPPLAVHFLKEFCRDHEVELGEDLADALKRHPWPGNVRELRNEIQRILVLSGGKRLLGADLFHGQPQPLEGRRATRERRSRLLALFEKQSRLTLAEAIRALECAKLTAMSDLDALEAQGVIRRVRLSSGRTSCYVRGDK